MCWCGVSFKLKGILLYSGFNNSVILYNSSTSFVRDLSHCLTLGTSVSYSNVGKSSYLDPGYGFIQLCCRSSRFWVPHNPGPTRKCQSSLTRAIKQDPLILLFREDEREEDTTSRTFFFISSSPSGPQLSKSGLPNRDTISFSLPRDFYRFGINSRAYIGIPQTILFLWNLQRYFQRQS